MKYAIVTLFVLVTLFACSKKESNGNLHITGNIKGLKKGTLYIQKIVDTALMAIDTIEINGDSHFSSDLDIQSPEMYYLFLDRGITNSLDNNLSFFAEAGSINIETSLEYFNSDAKITGSKNQEKYEEYKKQLEQTGQNEMSTTDPDSRLMCNNNNSVDVSYNVQTTVDSKHKLIVDFKVTQNPNDLGELDNMALRAKKIFKGKEFEALADKGYYKAEDLKKCVDNGITPYVTKQVYSNGTGDRDFYTDKFKFDKNQKVYICPAGKELQYYKERKKDGKVIGYEYRNYESCKGCEFKERCTKSKKGRTICRHVDQDFLDTIDLQTELNMEKYKLRQMIVEHPFGTVKRSWGAYYFLTKRKFSVSAEISLSFLVYNLKRVISILGTKEIIKRLRERKKPVLI